MAFNGFSRKTWTDRVSEYPTRRILTDTTSQATQQVTVSRDEGTVTSQGDTFDAETMNNLEARIASSFTEDEAAIGNLTNLTTTDKSNLVGALNEVKASVPPLVDELNDLDDVSISPATKGDGDTLIYNGNTAKWEDGQLQAAQVGFTPDTVSTSMPSGFTDVQKAVDYVCELADDLGNNKVDSDDFFFSINDEFSLVNGIFAGSLAGQAKDIYIFIPLPKSTKNVNSCTVSGNWYVRANGVNVVANAALSSVGTVATPIFCAGGVQIKCTLTTASTAANNSAITALGYTNAKLKFT